MDVVWHLARSFDIDLPTECDDEFWTNTEPELAFKQPPGKPSKVAFFNCYVRLHQILAFAMRTIVRLLSALFAAPYHTFHLRGRG